MTQEAMEYLNGALDYIQENSVRREYIDWPTLRQEVSDLVAHAQTPVETYPAIQRALELLGDHHSFFRVPEQQQQIQAGNIKRLGIYATYPAGNIGIVDTGSAAERAGVRSGDRVLAINGQSFSSLTIEQFRKAFSAAELDLLIEAGKQGISRSLHLQSTFYEAYWLPKGERLSHDIGYLSLPGLLVGNVSDYRKAYADTVQRLIKEIDKDTTSGWVIDLRCNVGGGVWPMWAGIGPVLGEGKIAAFVGPGETLLAIYRAGKAIMEPGGVIHELDEPYELKHPWPPVAVLTGPLTGSSGEFVALAFRERPHTRSFGEPTFGVPTGNDSKRLNDGALIALTTHLGADRTGLTYDSPLLPDHPIMIDWAELGTDDDPVLQAAIKWLSTEVVSCEKPINLIEKN